MEAAATHLEAIVFCLEAKLKLPPPAWKLLPPTWKQSRSWCGCKVSPTSMRRSRAHLNKTYQKTVEDSRQAGGVKVRGKGKGRRGGGARVEGKEGEKQGAPKRDIHRRGTGGGCGERGAGKSRARLDGVRQEQVQDRGECGESQGQGLRERGAQSAFETPEAG